LDEVPPVFGITRPAQTWNPIRINFQHLGLLISDAWRAKNWKDKLTIWFKPTGWRPENFEEKYFGRFPEKKGKHANQFSFIFTPTWWRFTDWNTPEGKKILSSDSHE
jgi:hypothetical protein